MMRGEVPSQGKQAASRAGRGKHSDSPLEAPEGASPSDTVTLAHETDCKRINLCCFQTPSSG